LIIDELKESFWIETIVREDGCFHRLWDEGVVLLGLIDGGVWFCWFCLLLPSLLILKRKRSKADLARNLLLLLVVGMAAAKERVAMRPVKAIKTAVVMA